MAKAPMINGTAEPPAPGVVKWGAFVAQHDVDLIWYCLSRAVQKVAGRAPFGLLMELDKGELARSIDGDDRVEFAFGRLYPRNVDVEEADRVALELGLGRLLALDGLKPADPMSLEAAI